MPDQLKRVLVLEDDPNARAALCFLLDDWGYEPIPGVSAREVLAAAAGAAIYAVISDYDLGRGASGIEEVEALRAAGVSAPVLVLSGTFHRKAGESSKLAGHSYLAKPVAPDDLAAWLAALP